jgi:hypothetical protein
MRCLILAPTISSVSGSSSLFSMLRDSLAGHSAVPAVKLADVAALPANCVAEIAFDGQSAAQITSAATGFSHKILLLRDPRDFYISQLQNKIAQRPELARNPVFVDDLLAIFKAKQEIPQVIELAAIARLFDAQLHSFFADTFAQLTKIEELMQQLPDWQVVYHEDLQAGNLKAVNRYLGVVVKAAGQASQANAAQWRNWFTSKDVANLRGDLSPLLNRFGYDDQWELAATPTISAAESWEYVAGLVKKIGAAAAPVAAAAAAQLATPAAHHANTCNICGGTEFGPGPNGRKASTGLPPHCISCDALERQRIVRKLFQALPLGFIDWRRGLQFSPDPGVCADQFRHYEVSVYGGQNSLDMQAIARADGAYDFISFNHVLEFVPDDLQGFAEMARVLSSDGMMQACFSAPTARTTSVDYATPFGPHQAWHLYGTDLAQRFECEKRGLHILAVEEADPCTGAREIVHFFLKNPQDVQRLTTWFQLWSDSVRIIS